MKRNNFYCPLPFNSISSNTTGYYALCCEAKHYGSNVRKRVIRDKGYENLFDPIHCTEATLSEFKNSDYMKHIRDAFNSDNPLESKEVQVACYNCIEKEKLGLKSKRQRDLDKFDDESRFFVKNFGADFKFLELKLIGNICNLECVMCSEYSSSKIAERKGVDKKLDIFGKLAYPKYPELSDEWWDDFKNIAPEYKGFKFSGGEPFMSPVYKKAVKILEEIGHTDIRLQFGSNGSASKKTIEKLCQTFAHISLNLSVESWGERNNIIRLGSDWDFMESRIYQYCKLAQKYENLKVTLSPCINILNIGYLHEFEDWHKAFSVSGTITLSFDNKLLNPPGLNISNIPNKVREKYWNDNIDFLTYNSEFEERNKNLIDNLRPALIDPDFKRSILWLNLNIPDWEKWYPEYVEYK